ncbi:MAG TPA: hypothetical protein VIA62_06715 [Thermoanaerobaculia bacterium]|nr:hypothetical protein [Thermoanaerobaculia bacterium]
MIRRALLLLALSLLAAPSLAAGPIPKDRIPAPLQTWTDWVMRGHEHEVCPFFLGAADAGTAGTQCDWPGRLALDLGEKEGRFRQEWTLQIPGFVPLPGEEKHWPVELTVDGRPAAAVENDGAPGIWLPAGRHTLAGAFRWDSLPESLDLSQEVGLVSLTVRGAAVPFPDRDADGRIFLQRASAAAATEAESLEVIVHRKVIDAVPLVLVTRLQLAVSGKAREVLLGRALPDRFIPLELASSLPARIEPDGRLRVQVRPGSWTLELTARHDGPVSALTAPAPGGPWANEEVWVFEAQPSLRLADVEGVAAVDPQQTSLPEEWKKLPAYRLRPGETLRFAEHRRGDADPAPDRLALHRILWLDFDGGGYTWSDRLAGTLTRSWRLEMAPPSRLERVAIAGREQVITRRAGSRLAGIEVRQGTVVLGAEGRIEDAWALPAVGWDHDFQQVTGELHLPPGWRILGATGIDEVPGTWIGRWTLLDLFLVLIIALAVRHLWGTRWGLIALAAMVLSWQEPDAPQWVWIVVLALEALRRLLPADGRLRTLVRAGSVIARAGLILVLVAFVARQVRQAIYPALERPEVSIQAGGEVQDRTLQASLGSAYSADALSSFGRSGAAEETRAGGEVPEPGQNAPAVPPSALTVPPPPPPPPAPKPRAGMRLEIAKGKQAPAAQPIELQEVDPRAVVDTGPGLPEWEWTRVSLRWSGPVEKSQRVRFFLLSPLANGLLAFVRAALLILLALLTLDLAGLRLPWRLSSGGTPPAAAAVLLVLLLLPLMPALARAEDPPATPAMDVLDQLRQALTEKPDCFPGCAASPRLFLDVSPAGLRARFEVGAAAEVAVPIPGGAQQWVPAEVQVDGQPAGAARTEDGRLWVRVGPGRHEILLAGPLPPRDGVQIPLPLKPHRVEVTASGWTVSGVHEDGEADDTLQLARVRGTGPGGSATAGALQPSALPPFLEVERTVRLGLTWQVETRVSRRSPEGAPAAAEVPLLPGESVTTSGIRVKNGAVEVSLGPQTDEVTWTSSLAIRPALVLTAPRTLAWTEVWKLDASPIWHFEAKGIPAVLVPAGAAVRVPEWHPWPGERVELVISRPEGIAGRTLTLVRSQLGVAPGVRSTDVSLDLALRSSRGGQHTIVLPPGAELTAVTIDGRPLPIRQEGRRVTLPIHPGAQRAVLAWRERRGTSLLFRTPAVDLKTPSVNALTTVDVPRGRWLLLAGGPRLGPAVLFWSLLLVILLTAWGLGRVRLTPLRTRDWALLGVGLSQVPLAAGGLVAAWLLVLGLRRERGAAVRRDKVFDLVQLVLVIWTLVALGILFWSIQQGLLGTPEMQVAGNGSTASQLRWYADRAGAVPPGAWMLSVPLLVYRLAMLAWALWLAVALLRWLRWAWESFTTGGGWRPWVWFPPKPPRVVIPPRPRTEAAAPPPSPPP